ncbi:MAG: type IV secretion system DNA-binding domain-containing protein [Candidatus Niyogibacteria bacterium]|nr:type IV secretion system DNA-binding domain-containing protein [Candidatus Niyogibacteria bacterium]
MNPATQIYLYIGIVTSSLAIAALSYSIYLTRKRHRLMAALDMVLYEVAQPREELAQGKSFKDVVAVMEQFYAGMSSLKKSRLKSWLYGPAFFALELANPEVGEEMIFYAAVPRAYARFFEKQAESFFPHARLAVVEDDYNIFNSAGGHAAGIVKLTHDSSPFLPIKTYQKMDADPLEGIANAFSKIRAAGEGASLQLILSPDTHGTTKELKRALQHYKETGKLSRRSFAGEILHGIGEILFPKKKKTPDEIAKKVDEEVKKLLEEKLARPIFAANIRIVTSARTDLEAQNMLRDIGGAFAQFNDPRGASFIIEEESAHSLETALCEFIMRTLDEREAVHLNTAELTSILHFPVGGVATPKMKFAKFKTAEPPANLLAAGTVLGKSVYRGAEALIRITREDRRRHFYIIGQTGTGKSNIMKHMIRQDIENGEGVCVIDPHGELADDVLGYVPKSRVDDVIYFDPGNIARPMGLNMLEFDTARPEQKSLIINELFEIFNKLFNMATTGGPMFEQYFRNAAMLVMDDPSSGNTLLEIGRVLAEKSFRDHKLSRSTNPVVKSFWRDVAEKAGGEASLQNMVPYITSKFDTFLTNEIMRPIIMQERSAFDFRKVMDEKKILVVNLSKGKLGDLNANLLGLIIVGRLSIAALSRIDTPENERPDFYLHIDEFQNVTTKAIATILSEARKYRLDMTIAHQFIGQLQEEIQKAVFGNVGSLAVFRVGAEDAEFLEKQFTPVFDKNDMMNVANYNALLKLLIRGQVERPFNIESLPPVAPNRQVASALKELSALKYGRPRAEVEAEINKKYNI